MFDEPQRFIKKNQLEFGRRETLATPIKMNINAFCWSAKKEQKKCNLT